MEERRGKELSSSSDGSCSELLSQLDALKEDDKLQAPEPPADPKVLPYSAVGEVKSEIGSEVGAGDIDNDGREEILHELRKVKRQNFITHCLLSTLIVITVVFQLSEVSLALKVKDRLSHPFRSIGGMLTGMVKGPIVNGHNEKNESSAKKKQNEILPPIKIPELPHLELPLISDSDED